MYKSAICFAFLIGLFGLVAAQTAAELAASYPGGNVELNANYKVYWKVDATSVSLALDVNTQGWFGLGFGEPTSGSMPGGDFVTIQFENSQAVVKDRWSDKFGLPDIDCSQDWTLVKFTRQANGRALAEIRRALDTGDTQDRPITAGLTRVLFAWGPDSSPAYHGNNRGMGAITFINSTATVVPTLEADAVTATFQFTEFVIPPAVTTYACQSFALPTDRKYHIVSVGPFIAEATREHVHHFIAYQCTYNGSDPENYANKYSTPGMCFGITPMSGCTSAFYSWASGVQELRLPQVAGFPIGQGFTHIVLEVHYDNPNLYSGRKDSSGITVRYTPTLRQYDAGVLVTGDPGVQFGVIPANSVRYHLEGNCPGECSASWPHDITVFGSMLHMHARGRQIWTTQWRGSERIGYLNRADFFEYNMQQITFIDNKVIRRGDRLNTHCTYTTGSSPVNFGPGTHDEMCQDFITYYPRLYIPTLGNMTFTACGYLNNQTTLCGLAPAPLPNPSIPDPVDDRKIIFGTRKAGCVDKTPTVAGTATRFSFSVAVIFAFVLVVASTILL